MNVPAKHEPDEPPPFLGTWKRVYIGIVIYLAVLITVYSLFTRAYAPGVTP